MLEQLSPVLLVDIAIAWMVIENIFSFYRYRRREQGAMARWVLANAAAGLMLLLVARLALSGAATVWLAALLALALLAHLLELAARKTVNRQ